MKRRTISPRDNWQQTVESQGMLHHTTADDSVYWDESAYYEFSAAEVDALEAATNTLQEMCLAAGQKIIDENLFARMNISEGAAALIRKTWEEEPPAIYGRFDLAYDGRTIKLLEYNADTPTSLLEAAVIQWYWLQDQFPKSDQFNSIHERLVAKWKELVPYVGSRVHFASLENYEDIMTNTYLMETARQGGLQVIDLAVREIGYEQATGRFVDLNNEPITTLFKLYPWENLLLDDFGQYLGRTSMQVMEPAWKMMWSNKALLAILWEMYPRHQYLLPAYFESDKLQGGSFVRKPFISREGANMQVVKYGRIAEETVGPYQGPYIFQEFFDLPSFSGNYPVLGSWVIDGEAAGMGIRESNSLITGNTSRFVPHLFG